MINQLTEEGLSGKSRNVKVNPLSGATISDIKFHLMKILPKNHHKSYCMLGLTTLFLVAHAKYATIYYF